MEMDRRSSPGEFVQNAAVKLVDLKVFGREKCTFKRREGICKNIRWEEELNAFIDGEDGFKNVQGILCHRCNSRQRRPVRQYIWDRVQFESVSEV
jgi:hypothetical protein